ncbi:MAG: DNA-3-methyladenine glycosylase I [Gemmatimonadales bacterium]|nr:DNA-3-methyladenine glycosylase I [Gemmatimonadales bacterium]
MTAYHDEEWGVPVRDDRALFGHLVLDSFQAGLSWAVILNKRDAFRHAFADFDPDRIARFNARSVERLLRDSLIVRNRQKIEATIRNARAFLRLRRDGVGFADFLWRFVDGRPRQNRRRGMGELPSRSPESDRMSLALREAGFSFVGTTICYAFMQAVGMVNDHVVGCFRYREVGVRRAR